MHIAITIFLLDQQRDAVGARNTENNLVVIAKELGETSKFAPATTIFNCPYISSVTTKSFSERINIILATVFFLSVCEVSQENSLSENVETFQFGRFVFHSFSQLPRLNCRYCRHSVERAKAQIEEDTSSTLGNR